MVRGATSACRRQTSLIAGTIFACTKVPLRVWFRAMYHLTQSKQGISSIELGRRLGVTQTTAWTIKHKLAQVMLERDAEQQLNGRVELDDAYLGGERSGGKRAAAQRARRPSSPPSRQQPEGKPVRLKLRRVTSFCNHAIAGFAKRSLDPDLRGGQRWPRPASLLSPKPGCQHQVIKTGSGPAAARTPAFKWVNTALGNMRILPTISPGDRLDDPVDGDRAKPDAIGEVDHARLQHHGGRTGRLHPAGREKHDVIGEAGRQPEIVQADHHANAARRFRLEQGHGFQGVGRIEVRDRLVREDDVGLGRQDAGEREPGAFPLRQLVDPARRQRRAPTRARARSMAAVSVGESGRLRSAPCGKRPSATRSRPSRGQ